MHLSICLSARVLPSDVGLECCPLIFKIQVVPQPSHFILVLIQRNGLVGGLGMDGRCFKMVQGEYRIRSNYGTCSNYGTPPSFLVSECVNICHN